MRYIIRGFIAGITSALVVIGATSHDHRIPTVTVTAQHTTSMQCVNDHAHLFNPCATIDASQAIDLRKPHNEH